MFQLSGFQRNAFQIGFVGSVPVQGGGSSARPTETTKQDGNWRRSYNEAMAKLQDSARLEYIQEQKRETQREIDLTEIRLAKIEKRRLAKLADITLQNLLLAELQQLQALEVMRAELQQQLAMLIDEEEAILVLLLSSPFYA